MRQRTITDLAESDSLSVAFHAAHSTRRRTTWGKRCKQRVSGAGGLQRIGASAGQPNRSGRHQTVRSNRYGPSIPIRMAAITCSRSFRVSCSSATRSLNGT